MNAPTPGAAARAPAESMSACPCFTRLLTLQSFSPRFCALLALLPIQTYMWAKFIPLEYKDTYMTPPLQLVAACPACNLL
jgi:hypothetical protein